MKKVFLILVILLCITACDESSIGAIAKIILLSGDKRITQTVTLNPAEQLATSIQKTIDALITKSPTIEHKQIETFVYQTLEAMKPTATQTPDAKTIMETSVAGTIDAMANSSALTATAFAKMLPSTPTPMPIIPTVMIAPCDKFSFVSDITIPDGSVISPGKNFQKVWRLKNVGSCVWTPSYQFVFITGDQMGAPAAIPIGKYVYPGETIDLAINMLAPTGGGKYRGYWRMRNGAGILFGMGKTGHDAVWVDIKVEIDISNPPPPPPLPRKGCEELNFYIDWWVDGRFTAVFEVENTGYETWDKDSFDIAYISGDDFLFDDYYHPTRLDLPKTVPSGSTVLIEIGGFDEDKGKYQFQSQWGIVKGSEVYCELWINY